MGDTEVIKTLRPLPIIVFRGKSNVESLEGAMKTHKTVTNPTLRVEKCLPVRGNEIENGDKGGS